MEYKAEARNIKVSPRKVRLVVDSIKKLKSLDQTLVALTLMDKRAAIPVRKVIESAVANASNNFKASKDTLILKSIFVGEGVAGKRYHYAARGRVRPYKRRTSHITVVLDAQQPVVKKEVKKIEEPKVEASVEKKTIQKKEIKKTK